MEVDMRIIIFFIFILQILIGCSDEVSSWPLMRFEQTKWSQASESDRFIFVRDLIDSKKLNGLTKLQVIDLLGKPSYDHINGKYVTYIVKADSGTVYILDIRFKEQFSKNIVDEVGVRSD